MAGTIITMQYFSRSKCAVIAALFMMIGLTVSVRAAHQEYYQITVKDDQTGRGVPLVELRIVNDVRYYTDSNGIVALDDPELMGQKIYFQVTSPGYEYPADGFGYHGITLLVTAGGKAVIKIHRSNIAERLYRLTGAGIYRDSVLVGHHVPIQHPLLDGLVMGQDTVFVTPYQHKLFWFFGDTERPSYPLGQFAISGATSLSRSQGGLDPSVGVNLSYWTDASGFSRPMIPIANAPGPVWIGGLFTMQNKGQEHLYAHYAEIHRDNTPSDSGLAVFDDAKAMFVPIAVYPKGDPLHPEGHPFRVHEGGQEYEYFGTQEMGAFPLVRCMPDLAHIADYKTYEAFTCLAPGTRYNGTLTPLDRDASGHLIWAWKANTAALGEDEAAALVAAGKMKPQEVLTQLRDVETDSPVISHGGSVFWNSYRKRWILITTQAFGSPSFLGEVWFSEADTPVGPWVYARKIATHSHYTFYNPAQHPFFDQDGGRVIYFEGTYVNTYSDVKDITPRYNYNQLMYRLALDDPRLSLPMPVYAVENPHSDVSYETREQVAAWNSWAEVQSIPFYAVPASRSHPGLIAVYTNGAGELTTQKTGLAFPTFYALPATASGPAKPAPAVVPLYEYKGAGGQYSYSTDPAATTNGATRSPEPLCRVWRNPSSVLALDSGAVAG
jgi:hypothetical protein